MKKTCFLILMALLWVILSLAGCSEESSKDGKDTEDGDSDSEDITPIDLDDESSPCYENDGPDIENIVFLLDGVETERPLSVGLGHDFSEEHTIEVRMVYSSKTCEDMMLYIQVDDSSFAGLDVKPPNMPCSTTVEEPYIYQFTTTEPLPDAVQEGDSIRYADTLSEIFTDGAEHVYEFHFVDQCGNEENFVLM